MGVVRYAERIGVWRLIAVVLFAAGCLAGCATAKPGESGAGAERTIWSTREQFVKVVPQERGEGASTAANEHPATVAPAVIRRFLASVRLSSGGKEGDAPLFTDTELKVLEDALTAGLAQAGPAEDVTFAVIGNHPTLMGLVKEPKVTTGRVFMQDGRLNLILGRVQREVNEREDRRLYPFVPGSRQKEAVVAGKLVPAPGGVQFTVKRGDWLVFSPAASVPPEETAEPAKKIEPPTAPPTTPPKGVEERLRTLNDLKGKGLITDEEYREKRREILKEL